MPAVAPENPEMRVWPPPTPLNGAWSWLTTPTRPETKYSPTAGVEVMRVSTGAASISEGIGPSEVALAGADPPAESLAADDLQPPSGLHEINVRPDAIEGRRVSPLLQLRQRDFDPIAGREV